MKTEDKEKEDAGSMQSLESRTVRGRERESKHRKTLFKTLFNLHVCVFNAHFYTSPYKD